MSGVVSGWLIVDSAYSFVVSLAVVEGSGVFVGRKVVGVAVVLVSMTGIVVAVVVAGTVIDVVVWTSTIAAAKVINTL